MEPESHLDVLQILDTDFVLLPDAVELDQALGPILRKPGRLGIVQSDDGTILGCLDSFRVAKALMEEGGRTRTLGQLKLQETIVAPTDVTSAMLIQFFSEDIHRPVIVRSEAGSVVGHLTSVQLLRWLMPQARSVSEQVSNLEQELARRDEYLGIVAHDLRAPLSVIQLAVDYVQLPEHMQTISEQLQSFIERIKRNSDSAQFLVTGLLDSLRSQGGLQLAFDQVLYSSLVDDAVKSLRLVAQQKEQTIVARHTDEIKVYLDTGRIRQVLENLIMNAIKYSPVKSQITVQTQLAARDGLTYAVCKVTNPGKNISATEGKRLFEPFVQGSNAEALKDGVGLGLTIVHKVVELHEGFIEVGSEQANEVCFQVFLPNASSVLGSHRDQIQPSGQTILVVDDDEEIREFTEEGLTAAGFHVYTADNGARAFSIFQRHKPQLIISDIRMNDVDGFELLAKVRAASPQTPVILFSGFYAGLERDLKHSDLKPDLFVDKPFRVVELVEHIKRLLS
ncbi:hybrid sensor histidine kinase/response regulator [Oligoflexus tunisiensis]|uniref:hybrid sensor histidine kinase/response regulator n=1 Tax=Oligoflexus tunisiensis TaxID=708132 RepID=UPI00114CDF6F|nr:hybrid sensor histidine kinase/response regulator [Oligoflexus tunisiensis]